jgi:signal transduction histidine kinase
LNSGIYNLAVAPGVWKSVMLLAICCTVLCGCRRQIHPGPRVEFTRVPLADEGGPDKLDLIEGLAIGARPSQQIVLFARSGAWYVQPFANEPFTQIQSDSKWRSSIHLGTEYAALLVEPGYQPPSSTAELPGEGGLVVAVTVKKGEPVYWLRWWFLVLCGVALMSVVLALHNYRLQSGNKRIKLRFEERLAERAQIAQELHDTLLQGVISASMHLHVAVDRVPEDLPAKPSLTHVQQVICHVIDDGRNALQRLRSSASGASPDIEQAFYRIQKELATHGQISFQVRVEGRPRPVHPIIRDEVYRIGREALLHAFRHSGAKRIEVEVGYKARYLRVVIRDDGSNPGPQMSRSALEDNGLSAMRERPHGVGARLRVRSRPTTGTEVELRVPGNIAFQNQPAGRLLGWLTKRYPRNARVGTTKAKRGEK